MRQQRTSIYCHTRGPGFHDLSREIANWLSSIDAGEGCVTLFIRHTSASLTIQENADPDVLRDLTDSLAGFAPQEHAYRHSSEGPDDMPAHIKTMPDQCIGHCAGRGGSDDARYMAGRFTSSNTARLRTTVRLSPIMLVSSQQASYDGVTKPATFGSYRVLL